jgi:hypothetical protein
VTTDGTRVYSRLTPFLRKYIEIMGWQDLKWLEEVNLGL